MMKSLCCNDSVRLNKPDFLPGDTLYYVCNKCNEACDMVIIEEGRNGQIIGMNEEFKPTRRNNGRRNNG